MDKFEKKMKDAGLTEAAIAAFRMNYDQLAGGATGLVSLVSRFADVRSAFLIQSVHFHSYLRRRSMPYQSSQSWWT